MKEGIKITGVLTSVCLLCAFSLSFAAKTFEGRIKSNEKKAVKSAIFSIAPECKKIKEINTPKYTLYKLFTSNGSVIGYGFLAKGQGYQGKIKIMAIADTHFNKLLGIEIIDSKETPGLGARINKHFFKDQFKELNVSVPIEYTKTRPSKNNEIKAITGATISSRSVVNILNRTIKKLRSEVILK